MPENPYRETTPSLHDPAVTDWPDASIPAAVPHTAPAAPPAPAAAAPVIEHHAAPEVHVHVHEGSAHAAPDAPPADAHAHVTHRGHWADTWFQIVDNLKHHVAAVIAALIVTIVIPLVIRWYRGRNAPPPPVAVVQTVQPAPAPAQPAPAATPTIDQLATDPATAMANTLVSAVSDDTSDSGVAAASSIAPGTPTYTANGRFELYRQGNIIWRMDTTTGHACILYAAHGLWSLPRVAAHSCAAR